MPNINSGICGWSATLSRDVDMTHIVHHGFLETLQICESVLTSRPESTLPPCSLSQELA